METIEASAAQLEDLRTGDPAEPLALVHFHRVRDETAYARYCEALDQAVQASGGHCAYRGRIDQVIVPSGVAYHRHRVDTFPSRELAAESMRSSNPHAKEALEDAFVIAVLPWSSWFRWAASLAAMLFRNLAGRRVVDAPPFPGLSGAPDVPGERRPEIEGTPEAAARFMEADQTTAFAVVNLNLPRERADYGDGSSDGISGEEAYQRYGKVVMPLLLRRGGRALFFGIPDGIVIGDAGNALARPWTQYALIYYPSRLHMRDMLATDEYQAATPHREAGLEAASLMPTTPDPGFAP